MTDESYLLLRLKVPKKRVFFRWRSNETLLSWWLLLCEI